MSLDDSSGGKVHRPADCTTTASFTDHGLARGSVLIQRTYYKLAGAGITEFDDSDLFFDQLEAAFTWAYIVSTDEPGVPSHVAAAIDDAIVWTRDQFGETDDVDLRTELLPRFYSELAAFHCRYRPDETTPTDG